MMDKKKEKDCKDKMKEILKSVPKNLQGSLFELARKAGSPEELYRLVMVGNCPICGSEKTRDCGPPVSQLIDESSKPHLSSGDIPPLNDSTIGLCLECHTMWCLECGEIFEKGQTRCKHWDVCDKCKFEVGCEIPTWECSIIKDWKAKQRG